jgi:hypothetical protein
MTATNRKVAERLTSTNSDSSISVRTVVYDEDGVTVFKESETVTKMNPDGSISEITA